ncbi:hydantoinase/oxoprolinase family protein [Pseudokordiimonas caeni]|uniref:hydantoinase/oxoprolinase family protein n=1 Tax=Pseudokordiimonas caeni TaxID=2997908 RepID=UPI0028121159|nr:hydantoinase/oxoprolinase family protein [Pseudokordiimonas caeni]
MRIGVDVGGTNTDAVLMDGSKVLASRKMPTTADVSSGIEAAIGAILTEADVTGSQIDCVMIGTTHFTNAFVQAKDLARVFALRIGAPAGRGIPPFSAWPAAMRDAVFGGYAMVRGGYEFDGRQIAPLDEAAIAAAARDIKAKGIGHVAVSGIFSQLNADQEIRAGEILADAVPGLSVSLSSQLGRVGLLERENAAIMNASLRSLADHVADAFARALESLGITAPFFVSQNDGTLMKTDQLRRYPVLTFAAGPTNSLRGAAWLTGLKDAIVVDIGGTTTDIGVLVNGFPRQSSVAVDIGGVRTNFRMPDIISIGLGGGSRVREHGGKVTVGPDSTGFRLLREGLIFGGATLTASDIAVASGKADFGDRKKVEHLDEGLVFAALDAIHGLVEDGIDRMKTSRGKTPMILVGGGHVLISRPLEGISQTEAPDHAGVANAVGAAIGQISGEIDRIYNIANDDSREAALADARERAIEAAVLAGADRASVEIVNIEAVPLQYLPGGATRVVCRAVGDLVMEKA